MRPFVEEKVQVACPLCDFEQDVPGEFAGGTVRCRSCRAPMQLPDATTNGLAPSVAAPARCLDCRTVIRRGALRCPPCERIPAVTPDQARRRLGLALLAGAAAWAALGVVAAAMTHNTLFHVHGRAGLALALPTIWLLKTSDGLRRYRRASRWAALIPAIPLPVAALVFLALARLPG
jgi:hypothetical protein